LEEFEDKINGGRMIIYKEGKETFIKMSKEEGLRMISMIVGQLSKEYLPRVFEDSLTGNMIQVDIVSNDQFKELANKEHNRDINGKKLKE